MPEAGTLGMLQRTHGICETFLVRMSFCVGATQSLKPLEINPMRNDAHLDGSIQVEDDISDVVGVVHSGDATHHQDMVRHTAVLDEAALGPKLLQGRSLQSLRG